MRIRLQPWQLAVLMVALSVAFIGVVRWRKNSVQYDAAHMVAALPVDRAMLVYADFEALRRGGILDFLTGTKAAQEADYLKFVEQTGFDYRIDLDAVAGAFVNGSSYFTVRGRFRWKQLAAYAQSQGGECHYTICSMPGSSLQRIISFYPLRPDVLALAVSPDANGVNMISPGQVKKTPLLPPEPVWISAPAEALTRPGALPAGIQTLLGPLAHAEKITLAAGSRGGSAQLRLAVVCRSLDDASSVKRELSSATDLLRNAAGEDRRTPDALDWAGLLQAGSFTQNGMEVTGAWPVERKFLEALASRVAP